MGMGFGFSPLYPKEERTMELKAIITPKDERFVPIPRIPTEVWTPQCPGGSSCVSPKTHVDEPKCEDWTPNAPSDNGA